jgi:DNA-binding response OmpR family regulator
MRILLVEDDVNLGDGVQAGLIQAGFGVDWAKTCDECRLALATGAYGCLVLDIGLPDGSGLDLLQELRRKQNPLPVLILTARDTLSDRVKGLDKGADDYLIKPFDLDELTARLRALLRRSHQRILPVLSYQGIVLDPAARTVTIDGKLVELQLREFTLLEDLLENQGRVLTRDQLEQSLYGWNAEIESNAIEVHVHHLRKKFGTDFIKTIRGVGYVINKSKGTS